MRRADVLSNDGPENTCEGTYVIHRQTHTFVTISFSVCQYELFGLHVYLNGHICLCCTDQEHTEPGLQFRIIFQYQQTLRLLS